MRRNNRGNILFLILLAIVLFVALSYVIMNQREQVGSGMSKEAANAAAADIDNWLISLDSGIQRMLVVNGIPLTQIDLADPDNYNYDGSKRAAVNQNCASNACKVFMPDGGGVISRNFTQYGIVGLPQPGYLGGYVGNGSREYLVANIANLGTSQNEVVVTINNIKQEICRAYNRRIGIAECPAATLNNSAWAPFWGVPGAADTNLNSLTPNTYSGAEINGRTSFCLCGSNPSRGSVYYAIIAR